MEFRGIKDALGKWVIVRLANWPEDLKGLITGLSDVEGRWLQFKLRGIDDYGIWLENPYFRILPSGDSEKISQEQREALQGTALVLVKWQYVASIVYLEGQMVDDVPVGFSMPSEEPQRQAN